MSDQIRPMDPPSEIVRVTRLAAHEIERICDHHGIILRRISARAEMPGQSPRGLTLSDELLELLYRILTEYDKFRTEQVEILKRQLTDCIARTAGPVIFEPNKSDQA